MLPDESLAAWWPLTCRDALRRELEAAYADPARGYHDTRHLAEVFARLDELAEVPHDRDAVLLAAWFHDAVYDGRAGDEERSAEWAEAALTGEPTLPDQTVAEVARLVRMTERHDPAEDDANGGVLSDADLAILAAPKARYDEYVAEVRREYAHVDDADFDAGRSAILADLLGRPALFHTAHAREQWEPAARANLARELSARAAAARRL